MENTVQQEILLIANSSISKRNLCEKDHSESSQTSSIMEQLAEACWNGMLKELLPGLLLSVKGKTLFLWQVQCANNFLHIDLCERPKFSNKEHSVDPYIFLHYAHNN
jgi:hypothetical protein